ncbi:MAG: glycoside hydrolase family 31 protein [Ruminococcaceae bacterium]|nr:glycoside hydrolase family 31 protein [Oscillospiraceae bacterium]
MAILEFQKILNGVWRATVGEGAATLLSLAGAEPRRDNGADLPFPFAMHSVSARCVGGKQVISIPFSEEETLYGLGLSFQSLRKNYAVVPLQVDHFGGKDNGRTHVPTPFYISDRGYGIFLDTTARPTFYMGGAVRKDAKNPPAEKDRGRDADWSAVTPSEFVEISFSEGGAALYVIAGEDMKRVAARFNLLCGGGCMVPKWGLGFWERLHLRSREEDVYRTVEDYGAHGLFPDVIGLEPGWQSNSYPCSLEICREKYPHFEDMTRDLLNSGIRLNLWENLYLSKKSPLYEKMYPLSGSHTVWNGIVPDLTLPDAREIYQSHHRQTLLRAGVSGFKIDECDGYDKYLWPDHAEFPSGNSAEALRQSYGVLCQRTVFELFRGENKRTYGLVRASNAGAVSFPFCVYNDCYTFSDYLNGICSSAFCGTLWVPEVRDAKTPEEWVRRFQLCALSPMMMLNSWATGNKPWKFPEVEEIIAGLIQLRRQLLPYLYNAFHTYATEGIPPFRPICMDFGTVAAKETEGELDDTNNPYQHKKLSDVTDQFLVGDALMVAPLMPGCEEREVVLPAGCKWYDFFTGEYVGSGEVKTLFCPLDRMLILVREGGMIPMLDLCDSEQKDHAHIVVKCFGEAGEGFLYDDDGETFDFEKGKYTLTKLSFERQGENLRGEATVLRNGYPSPYQIRFA